MQGISEAFQRRRREKEQVEDCEFIFEPFLIKSKRMKSKNSITQKREIRRRLQEGQEASFVNYGLDKEEVALAKNIAQQIGLPFSLVESILTDYHTVYISKGTPVDNVVQKIIFSALKKEDKSAIINGLFQSISKSA